MIYSQKLSNALVSISPYKLREIAGEKLVETATTLNENASSLRGIVELIKELHEPQKFVINIKFRQYIIETLSQNEALDLAKEFNYDGLGTSWNFLINLGNTQAIKNKFFNYFDLPSEEAKKAFLSQVPQEVLQEADNVDKEADEVERLVDLEKKEKEGRKEIEAAMQGVKEE